eukprot:scaffold17412_cov127-Isochrysis_galbana.AAC.2
MELRRRPPGREAAAAPTEVQQSAVGDVQTPDADVDGDISGATARAAAEARAPHHHADVTRWARLAA